MRKGVCSWGGWWYPAWHVCGSASLVYALFSENGSKANVLSKAETILRQFLVIDVFLLTFSTKLCVSYCPFRVQRSRIGSISCQQASHYWKQKTFRCVFYWLSLLISFSSFFNAMLLWYFAVLDVAERSFHAVLSLASNQAGNPWPREFVQAQLSSDDLYLTFPTQYQCKHVAAVVWLCILSPSWPVALCTASVTAYALMASQPSRSRLFCLLFFFSVPPQLSCCQDTHIFYLTLASSCVLLYTVCSQLWQHPWATIKSRLKCSLPASECLAKGLVAMCPVRRWNVCFVKMWFSQARCLDFGYESRRDKIKAIMDSFWKVNLVSSTVTKWLVIFQQYIYCC